MKKLKLIPSSKIKRRYLFLKAERKEDIEKAILDYIGILGWARASPVFVKNDSGFILSVNRELANEVCASFEISSEKINLVKISGTLDGLKIRDRKL